MSPAQHVPDEFYIPAPPPHQSSSSAETQPHHIIFVPGNPGCIAYYQTFLATLHQTLNGSHSAPCARYAVYGRSLRGFELNDASNHSSLTTRFKHGPWGLQAEIAFVEALIQTYVTKLARPSSDGKTKPKLILVGHSLGTFIIMEVLRRRVERARTLRRGEWSADAQFEIVAAVQLFPTVVDIVASPNGQLFGWLLPLPYAVTILSFLAGCVLSFVGSLGNGIFDGLVKWWTNMPEDAARVTATWLRRRNGVYQSLYLAADEMREMTADRWDADIWGSAEGRDTTRARTKLFFYFATKDSWIADKTRDELIATRGRRKADADVEQEDEWKPSMEIDKGMVPHGFCIRMCWRG